MMYVNADIKNYKLNVLQKRSNFPEAMMDDFEAWYYGVCDRKFIMVSKR